MLPSRAYPLPSLQLLQRASQLRSRKLANQTTGALHGGRLAAQKKYAAFDYGPAESKLSPLTGAPSIYALCLSKCSQLSSYKGVHCAIE